MIERYALIFLLLIVSTNTFSEIILDNNGQKTLLPVNNNTIDIKENMGQRVGENLFHQFERFNVGSGETVLFTGDNQIKMVVNRVTGNEASIINGTIKSEIANADFWFLNKNGVYFGNNAQVDVSGAFNMSTASNVLFTNQQNSGEGQVEALIADSTNGAIVVNSRNLLSSQVGEIHIIANNVNMHDSILGQYADKITITPLNQNISGSYDIVLSETQKQESNINILGSTLGSGGSVNLAGDNVYVAHSMLIENSSFNSTTINAEQVNVVASELVFTNNDTSDVGYTVNGDRVVIESNSSLRFADGNAGPVNLTIEGNDVLLQNNDNLITQLNSQRDNVFEINTRDNLTVRNTAMDHPGTTTFNSENDIVIEQSIINPTDDVENLSVIAKGALSIDDESTIVSSNLEDQVIAESSNIDTPTDSSADEFEQPRNSSLEPLSVLPNVQIVAQSGDTSSVQVSGHESTSASDSDQSPTLKVMSQSKVSCNDSLNSDYFSGSLNASLNVGESYSASAVGGSLCQ